MESMPAAEDPDPMREPSPPPAAPRDGGRRGSTALLALADGTLLYGRGIGATGKAVGEVCFNTSITGYQEILTDPSYAGQIITFTFPHIGNVGANPDDTETSNLAIPSGARGGVLRARATDSPNRLGAEPLGRWHNARH